MDITQIVNYLASLWAEIAAWKIWEKGDDFTIGIVAGVVGGYITSMLISLRVPRLRISDQIVLTKQGEGRIKVINQRRRWWISSGDARALKAELTFVRIDEKAIARTFGIPLARDEVSILSHRKFIWKSDQNDYVFRTATSYDLTTEVFHRQFDYLRFRVTARDSFSNYEGITTKKYPKAGSRSAKRRYQPLIVGEFRGLGDVRIRTATEQ